jgi:hypothetical protein
MKLVQKGDTVFLNPFGAVSVDSLKKKNTCVLLVDGEDVYGHMVNGKVKPIRESDSRFSLRVPIIKNAEGQEVPAQEAVVLDVWRPE